MTAKDCARLTQQFAKCPVCGTATVGGGNGTLVCDTQKGYFFRKCSCGWSVEIKGLHGAKRGEVSEDELDARTELFLLMEQYPELPVIPLVGTEIVADDIFSRWIASWGSARLGKFWIGDNAVFLYGEGDPLTAVSDPACLEFIPTRPADVDLMADDEVRQFYEVLPWTDCILVNIDPPAR